MGLSSDISPHLPFLRRFSRSLTGSQQGGDAYVAALLESLIADPAPFDASPDIRTALYRAYCGLWESISLNVTGIEPAQAWEAAAKRHLSGLEPKAREAYLLLAVERFSRDEIGAILSRSHKEVAALLEAAARQVVEQVATSVLIIEDEPIIAMDLETLMESLGHTVTGIARTEREALRLASAKRPGLVLADIQLADGSSGIDAVNRMLLDFEVPAVFITAFPERLLTGIKPEPAFLITKPFMPDMVKAIVSQALFFDTKSKVGGQGEPDAGLRIVNA